MKYEDHLPMFIVDVLRHGISESIPSVVNLLNNSGCIGWREFWERDYSVEDVLSAVPGLVEKQLVSLYLSQDEYGSNTEKLAIEKLKNYHPSKIWLELESAGYDAWHSWNPPTDNQAP